MQIKTTLKAKGSIVDALKTVNKFVDLKTLKNKIEAGEFFKMSPADIMKDTIKSTVGLKSLRKSTIEIRKQRRAGKGGKDAPKASNLTKPLVETGNLLNSIKQSKVKTSGKKIQHSVKMLDYGLHQSNGFIVNTGGDFREGSCDRRRVPSRDFITTANKKGAEQLRKGLVSTYGKAMGKRRRIGQRTL